MLPVFNHAPIYTIVLTCGSDVNGRIVAGMHSGTYAASMEILFHTLLVPWYGGGVSSTLA
jgi:hypothetical protein